MSLFHIKEVKVIDDDYAFLKEELQELQEQGISSSSAIAILPTGVLPDNAASFVPLNLARQIPILFWRNHVQRIAKRRIIYSIYALTNGIYPESIALRYVGGEDEGLAPVIYGCGDSDIAFVVENIRRAMQGCFKGGNRPDIAKLENVFCQLNCPKLGARIIECVRTSYHWYSCWDTLHALPEADSIRGLCGGHIYRDIISFLSSQSEIYNRYYLRSEAPLHWPEIFKESEILSERCNRSFRDHSSSSELVWKEAFLYLAAVYFRFGLDSIKSERPEEAVLNFVRCLESCLQGVMIIERVVDMDFTEGKLLINHKSVRGCGNYIAAVKLSRSAVGRLETRVSKEEWAKKTNGLLTGRNNVFLAHGLSRLNRNSVNEYICTLKERLEELLLQKDWDRFNDVANQLRQKPGEKEMKKLFHSLLNIDLSEYSAQG